MRFPTARQKTLVISTMVLAMATLASQAIATWKIVYTQPSGHGFRACFFFNESTGFAAGELADGVYKTTDGGMTWTPTKLPPYPDGVQPTEHITQILMTDATHGWLTCEPLYHSINGKLASIALYRTTDAGASWQPVLADSGFADVYQSPTALILSSRELNSTGFVSYDNGTTFSRAIPVTNGLDFSDNLHGVATGFVEQDWYRTADGGQTWLPVNPLETVEAWSVYAVKGTANFFAAPEGDFVNLPQSATTVLRSADYGATWTRILNLPFMTTGHLAGFGTTLYVQVNDDPAEAKTNAGYTGMYRSKDGGLTWAKIGGPANLYDTRFAILGCRGEVIYAFDDNGHIWKTTDGGDGSLPQFTLPAAVLNIDSIDICRPRDTVVLLKNLGCDTVLVDNAIVPVSPSLTVVDPATGETPVYPITIPPDSNGKLELILTSTQAGPYATHIVLQVEREGIISYDTIAVNSALRLYDPLRAESGLSYDSTSLCASRDTTFTLVNDSCFTVQIVSSQLKSGSNFLIDTPWKNDSIPAYAKKSISILFAPNQTGKISDSLVLNVLILGEPMRLTFPLNGIGRPDSPQLVMADRFGMPLPSKIEFDTMTRCQDSIFAFTIFERGCDSLYSEFEWLDSTQKALPPTSEFKWFTPFTRWLTQNATPVDAGIEVIPTTAEGDYTGYLRISDSVKGSIAKFVRMIPYHVFIKPGSKRLLLDSSLRNFDTIAFCDARDTIIELKNLGCDTLHFWNASFSGTNFIFPNGLKLPFVITPYDSVPIEIEYLPNVSRGVFDTLTFFSDDDSEQIRTVPLTGYATPTDTVRFRVVASNISVAPGDTSTVIIYSSGSFNAPGLTSIGIELAYNADVMEPFNMTGAHSGIAGAAVIPAAEIPTGSKTHYWPLTITGANMNFDSTVALLSAQFRIMLSDSLSTDFRIQSITLNNSNIQFNKCLLGAVSDSGTIGLKLYCGDSLMYEVMRFGKVFSPSDGIAPEPISAHPNPLMNGSPLTIPFRALRPAQIELDITDVTGRTVYSSLQEVTEAGESAFSVPAPSLASGAYHYRIYTVDGGRAAIAGNFVVLN